MRATLTSDAHQRLTVRYCWRPSRALEQGSEFGDGSDGAEGAPITRELIGDVHRAFIDRFAQVAQRSEDALRAPVRLSHDPTLVCAVHAARGPYAKLVPAVGALDRRAALREQGIVELVFGIAATANDQHDGK
jgi:hypothetical protein